MSEQSTECGWPNLASARAIFESSDSLLLYAARSDHKALKSLFLSAGVGLTWCYSRIREKNIDLKPIKELFIKEAFFDTGWFDDEYSLEDGEDFKHYSKNLYITNYGTPLLKCKITYRGVEFTKYRAAVKNIINRYYRIKTDRLYVHKIVASVWVENKKPNTYKKVSHKNKNTLDNHYFNLYWT